MTKHGMTAWQRHRAARVVAAAAGDAAEAALLLEMTGLSAAEGCAPPPDPAPRRSGASQRDRVAARAIGVEMVAAIRAAGR